MQPVPLYQFNDDNLAYMLGQKRIWDDGFYAGTFGEYDFGAIRATVRTELGQ